MQNINQSIPLSVNGLELETILWDINYLKKTKYREIKDMTELQGFMQLIESLYCRNL